MATSGTQPEGPPGPSMLAFWSSLLEPLIAARKPERILEIGADSGQMTRVLVAYVDSHAGVLHSIDPNPSFDAGELEKAHKGSFFFHRALSLEILPGLEPVEFALIDGDHNHYTVLNELRLLEHGALEKKAELPVVALHDIGWPYGRRDLYYDPEKIPPGELHPYARRAMRPGSVELVDEGINAHLANATRSADEHMGVRGAIDDFIAESEHEWRLFEVAGQHGLGVLVANEVLAQQGRMRDLLKSVTEPEFLQQRIEAVERERIETEIRRVKAAKGRAGVEAAVAKVKAIEAERDRTLEELDEAEHRAGRLQRRHDAAEEREAGLEDELAEHRRRIRVAGEETEAAEDRRAREARRIAELEDELEAAREEARADAAAAVAVAAQLAGLERRAEEADRSRTRLVSDFENERESLERAIDELRSQADTGHHAAAELREMLEGRELELERVTAELGNLRSALGRAETEAEVARTEKIALERRFEDMAALHEQTLAELEALPAAPPPGRGATAPKVELVPSEDELEALESFASEYVPLAAGGPDLLALPSPNDRRGCLLGADAVPAGDPPSVDVVVAVHNALEDVRTCLWSLVHKASYRFRLIIVNDGSDAETTAYLKATVAANPEITLIENETPPHGYTIAANLGMREARGDYVVLLNSDTVVSYGWLERIVACGESDERIGILGPLSNAASHQSVPEMREGGAWATNPLPPFVTVDGVAKLLERLSSRTRPRMPFINGFCYVVKRAVFEEIGLFDEENFASGYCEENDFSYRAGVAGFELAVVDDCYVYHAKSKSYSPEVRTPIAARNYEIFLDKHGREEIKALVAEMESDSSLNLLRYSVSDALSSPASLPWALDAARHDRMTIAFILPGLGAGGSGGSHSIYQEVKGLRLLGLPARIMLPERAWDRASAAYDDAHEVFETFAGPDELAEKTADADVISATHFKSVAMLSDLNARRQDFLPAYYIQDYEPFFTAGGSNDVLEAIESYTAISDCLLFAKTHWLCNIVGDRHGLHVAKVEPSIDERLFRPSDLPHGDGPLRVTAMIRPRTPRRQPTATIAVLEALQERFGERVELTTFGCGAEEMVRLTKSVSLLGGHQGLLTRQEVARLLSRSDVFLDMSIYQAFGRTALEAMACGCTAVVPRLGGAWEFVEDGVNARAVETRDVGEGVDALSEMVLDRERVSRLQTAGRRTARRYSIGRAALSEYLVFAEEHARRFGGDRAEA